MLKESKLQQMQRRLHVDKMEDNEKKKMMDKLQKAGGQVIDLEPRDELPKGNIKQEHSTRVLETRKLSKEEQPRKPVSRRAEIPRPKKESAFETKAAPQSPPQVLPQAAVPTLKPVSYLTVLAQQLNCVLSWIFNLGARSFREAFVRFVCQDYQNALLTLSNALLPLYNNDIHALEFRKHLFVSGNLSEYELGFYTLQLFQADDFSALQKSIPRGVAFSEEPFKRLYRELHYLRRHSTHSKVAIPLLLRRYSEFYQKKGKDLHYSASKVGAALNLVWDRFYQETAPLMQFYWAKHSYQNKKYLTFEEYIEIPADRKPIGAMAADIQALIMSQSLNEDDTENSFMETESNGFDEKPEDIIFPSEEIERGIDIIISRIDFAAMYENFREGRDLRAYFTLEDKIFYTYCILDYFDSEFSILWSGNSINFYVLSDRSRARYDPKRELIQLNGRINRFYEQTNEYLRQCRSYREVARSGAKGTKRVFQSEHKEKDISNFSFATRRIIIKLIEEYIDHLNRIIRSKDKEESIVGNWKDLITVSERSVERKFVSGMTVEKSLQTALDFLLAAEWLLKKSDLSGSGAYLIESHVIPYAHLSSVLNPIKAEDNGG